MTTRSAFFVRVSSGNTELLAFHVFKLYSHDAIPEWPIKSLSFWISVIVYRYAVYVQKLLGMCGVKLFLSKT